LIVVFMSVALFLSIRETFTMFRLRVIAVVTQGRLRTTVRVRKFKHTVSIRRVTEMDIVMVWLLVAIQLVWVLHLLVDAAPGVAKVRVRAALELTRTFLRVRARTVR